ncbi:MAG: aldose 1-epimerase family protein [Actinomycetota bacterium]|nr:aldose 1-epimerase family protein [Actinomycetota bacterium]
MPGPQYVLDHHGVRLEVAALAAALRSLTVDGVQLTEPYGPELVAPMGCGMVLAPWPNRVRDALWEWEGEPQLLDVTEPKLHNASHGLLRNTGYALVEQTDTSLTLGALIAPQHGWPFLLDTRVRYELDADGVTVTHAVTNLSTRTAPWAVGAHPYFRVGDVPSEELTVTLTGATRLELDDRFNPVGVNPVDADDGTGGSGSYDLRDGRPARGLDLNTGYGDLANRDGRADVAWLTAADGRCTTLWADAAFRWIQAYTPSDFPRDPADGGPGFAIALEPMTAPPNALNSGVDLIQLEPGASWAGSWGVRHTAAGGTR